MLSLNARCHDIQGHRWTTQSSSAREQQRGKQTSREGRVWHGGLLIRERQFTSQYDPSVGLSAFIMSVPPVGLANASKGRRRPSEASRRAGRGRELEIGAELILLSSLPCSPNGHSHHHTHALASTFLRACLPPRPPPPSGLCRPRAQRPSFLRRSVRSFSPSRPTDPRPRPPTCPSPAPAQTPGETIRRRTKTMTRRRPRQP